MPSDVISVSFAFRFLVEYYEILRRLSNEIHDVSSVLQQIKSTCLGHLKWLHLLPKHPNGQRFGSGYWVTGNLIKTHRFSDSAVANYSPVDAGFQILKAAASMDMLDQESIAADLMSQWAYSWLTFMETSDKRQPYPWPHAESAGFNNFRLDEQVWIWRALKALEMKGQEAWDLMLKRARSAEQVGDNRLPSANGQEAVGSTDSCRSKDSIARLHKVFASEVVQREITKSFTARNDYLCTQMIAVTRSPRRTRFLFHNRDTALFYDEEMPRFFSEDHSIQELWRNTINCQPYHDENQGSDWKILRHGLCIMMGTRGLRINEKPPDVLVQTATEDLFRNSSANGIFPGRLQEQYFHTHASFEIPYILLTHYNRVTDVYSRLTRPGSDGKKLTPDPSTSLKHDVSLHGSKSIFRSPQVQCDVSVFTGDTEQHQVLLKLSDFLLGRSTLPYCDGFGACGNAGRAADQQRLIMTKNMPFNGFIDSNSIIEIEDEWMFNCHEFFARKDPPDFVKASQDLKDTLHRSETSSGRSTTARYDISVLYNSQ